MADDKQEEQEQSMEDILASIRKIISEDDEDDDDAEQGASDPDAESASARGYHDDASDDDDILAATPAAAAAADDDDDIFENTAGRGRDFSGVNLLGEFFNGLDGLGDLSSDFGGGCEGRIAQPVVTDHAAFIGVGNCACFQLLEVGERLFDF